MDKYIKMLVIKLSEKYNVTVTSIMFSGNKVGNICNIFKFKLLDKDTREIICIKECNNKRELISEMMKWVNKASG